MVVDVPSAAGKATEEKPGLLIMGVCSLKEKRWPLWGAVIFEDIDKRLLLLTFKCQSVPLAPFVR